MEADYIAAFRAFFGDNPRLLDMVEKLFDAAFYFENEPKRQKLITGLAIILSCLEQDHRNGHSTGGHFDAPVLCKMQALQAAYELGVRDGVRGRAEPHVVRNAG